MSVRYIQRIGTILTYSISGVETQHGLVSEPRTGGIGALGHCGHEQLDNQVGAHVRLGKGRDGKNGYDTMVCDAICMYGMYVRTKYACAAGASCMADADADVIMAQRRTVPVQ